MTKHSGITRLLRLGLATIGTLLVVVACGSSDSGSGGTPPAATPGGDTAAPTSAAATTGGGEYGEGGGGKTTAAASGQAKITIKNFAFGAPLTVAPGTKIEVENEDTAGHDVSSDDGLFKTPTLQQGEKATFTAPNKPGTYKFSCTIHANMAGIGTLVVK